MAVVVQNGFQDSHTGYGEVPQRSDLFFIRRTYFTAIHHY
jgi:hypothetical protein